MGIILDDTNVEDITQQFVAAIDHCDIILSTGGISLGETDFIENIVMNQLVQSAGVQQSSRLLSLNHADGVLVLPQGTEDHPVAKTIN